MKHLILTIIIAPFCAFSAYSQDVEPVDLEKVISIVSAESFCPNLQAIIMAMPGEFEDIMGESTGGDAGGGLGGGVTYGGGNPTWESKVVFEHVDEMGEVGYELVERAYSVGDYESSKIVTEYYCEYMLITGHPDADWTDVFKGVVESVQRCMPQGAEGWEYADDALSASLISGSEITQFKINVRVNISMNIGGYGLILQFTTYSV